MFKNTIRKLFIPILAIAVSLSVAACRQEQIPEDDDEPQETHLQQMSSSFVSGLRDRTSFTWDEFSSFEGDDIGSGLVVIRYDLSDGGYLLVSGPGMDQDPDRIVYCYKDGEEETIFCPEMEQKRIEIGQFLGLDGCYCLREYYGNDHFSWSFYDSNDVEIARQFGFDLADKPDYYLKDLDSDGNEEVILNCTYGGDDCRRVFIYRNNNGVIEIGTFDDENTSSSLGLPAGFGGELGHDEYYDEDRDALILYYCPEGRNYEISPDDFIFQEYSSYGF